jgi:two-component system sensor histidine kinase PilS (NtrC family)
MISRAVFLSFLLTTLVLFQYRYHIYQIRISQLLYFAVSVYVASGVFWYLLKRATNLSLLAYLLICGDIVFISWLVTLTGVIDSGFSILYHITIISASIVLYRRGGYFSASLASILYGAMLDFQYYNLAGYTRSQNYSPGQVLYLLFVSILSFYVVAFLSGYLSERLRRTRQELREKSIDLDDLRAFQDNILRSVASGIVTMNMSGEVTSWNNAAEQITGFGLEDIRDSWKSIFGESIKGLFGHTEDLRERPIRFDGNIVKKDGSRGVLGFTASLLKDDRDLVRGIIVTFQDITRVTTMEEQMRRQERLATIGGLAAGIAHEIRNPLASLSGSIQILRDELTLQGENRQLMDIVLRETDRLNRIITEFLDFARPKSLQGENVVLGRVIDDTILLFQNSRDARDDVRIISDVPRELSVYGDPLRLRQIFWNLLINAAQSIPSDGTITITAATETAGNEEQIVIRVSDTGSGISVEARDKIFDPFFTTKADGTGLGLAIVYRIIDDHGGTVEVNSEQRAGTTFTIRLPSGAARRSKIFHS